MFRLRIIPSVLAVAALLALPSQARAQVPGLGSLGSLGSLSQLSSLLPILGVGTAPPALPSTTPPPSPGAGYQYTPGYWGYGQGGYSWVPGTYEQPPQPGAQWTPGYWNNQNGAYNWNPGYWGNQVGYYGGVDYGGGYPGTGYNPGAMGPPSTFTSYNGGPGGIVMAPTAQQLAIKNGHHYGLTQAQQEHIRESEADRNNLASVNKGKPKYGSVEHPYSQKNKPKDFAPITKSDRDAAAKNRKNGGSKNNNNANGNGNGNGKKNNNGGGKNNNSANGKKNNNGGGKNNNNANGKNNNNANGKNNNNANGKNNQKNGNNQKPPRT